VLLTHRAILNNMRAVRRGLGLTNADVGVNWVPLYHDMGLIDTFVLPLLSGCPSVLIPTMDFMREPALWLWAIHHYRGAQSWAPNFAYALCAKRVPEADLEGLDLSSWRLALSGAEPVLAQTVRAFAERFRRYGFRPEAMTPIWGMAENVTVATAHPLDEPPRVDTLDRAVLAAEQRAEPAPGAGVEVVSVGTCLPGSEVEIRDETRHPLPERHVGAIWLRSSYLFTAYNRDPATTAESLVDGWFDTGDRGYLAGGHLYFVARDKDLIVIGGEKYVPHDVENVINAVPGVREGCAVAFGVLNDERGTEDLAAVVETKETGGAELSRLGDAIRAEVMRAIGIGLRHLVLVPPGGIEKTTSGKLARRATRARYADRLG
jgi:acyl-CoA synthetase (AMP-forming)/AMP-acid ligase II